MDGVMQPGLVEEIAAAVGADRISAADDDRERHAADWTRWSAGPPVAVARPRSPEEVAAVVAICHRRGQPVAVQGGMTGLCGGASTRAGELALSLERLKGVERIEPGAMTVLAGTTVAEAQAAALAAGAELGIDFGARGTAAVGGAISTNAGGLHVIETGMTRAQVLGLEVVLADGRILSELNTMVKVNSGYDLKQLFIGTEGTLGIVTRAVLALRPLRAGKATAALALSRAEDTLLALDAARRAFGPDLSAFEAMWPDFVGTVSARTTFALPFAAPMILLLEVRDSEDAAAERRLTAFLEAAFEEGWLGDAVVAASLAQAKALWALRDEGPAAYNQIFGAYIPFDVSVPADHLLAAADALRETVDGTDLHPLTYGHVGDQNLHFVVAADRPFRDGEKPEVEEKVYAVVARFGGAVSAEHGIGQLKRRYLGLTRPPLAVELMQTLKAALDPRGILNPGRVI
jgi:FAD/FMN-containing dehydrogenase